MTVLPSPTPPPVALTIAGSDPSGGAGIQRDLCTFHSLYCIGTSVITALTAQNSKEVTGVYPVSTECIEAQIETLLLDLYPHAAKTGMLYSHECICAVHDHLPQDIPLVVDPVMVSTSGHTLLDLDSINTLIDLLVPRALIITPNLPEAELLSGVKISTNETIHQAGAALLELGVPYVLVKGGHNRSDKTHSVDLLFSKEGVISFIKKRFPYDVHGTGCLLSAAIAAYLAHGAGVTQACEQAKEFSAEAIANAVSGSCGTQMPGSWSDDFKIKL
ncbi:MAG: bifunctional hydroxymethylpyrimidine kinase/phosphomethylpyrimidine kinase [Methanomicrobiales archaeon]|jgi:hydroxymethylpyrimidine/phosphomethylpyrimidine kinase|nr:bifunctional hydroxymethylpyrimidine kinase/phosphomethylpyrimidine kinase [Methanomicrobiales archaeon]